MTPERKAEAAVNLFMQAWKEKNLAAMARVCQLTWIKETSLNVTDTLQTTFINRDLLDWKIRKITLVGQACRDVHVMLSYREKGQTQKRRIRIRTLCEKGPHEPSLLGSWGINPISASKNLN